ncbi:MAG TPA: FGGY-family carbohydrate kinase, partial [Solimonas sp.]|nr:FGGY-family carbohydrate kinase [Solimonas sp.]
REFKRSQNRLLSTIAYRINGETTYALEGSIFVAGAAVQWLRDAMHLIRAAGETEKIAKSIPDTDGVYLVPAFTGLGAPYWDPEARGAIFGLTRDSGIAHIVRAALESVGYQTRDLIDAMASDAAASGSAALTPPPLSRDAGEGQERRSATFALRELRIDGGMVVNDWLAQSLADLLQIPVVRPETVETTALGAAFLAGLTAGVYASLDDIASRWRAQTRFEPQMDAARAQTLLRGWHDAVARVRSV